LYRVANRTPEAEISMAKATKVIEKMVFGYITKTGDKKHQEHAKT